MNSKAVDSCGYPFESRTFYDGQCTYRYSKFDYDSVELMRDAAKKSITNRISDEKIKSQKQSDLNKIKELGLYNPDKNDYKKLDQWESDRYIDSGTSNCFFGKYKKITRIKNYVYTINYINPFYQDCFYEETELLMKMKANEGEDVKLIECVICKGCEFTVGRASYFTAVSCVNCGWEQSIHEG